MKDSRGTCQKNLLTFPTDVAFDKTHQDNRLKIQAVKQAVKRKAEAVSDSLTSGQWWDFS